MSNPLRKINAVTAAGFLYEAFDDTSNLWKLVPGSNSP